MVKAGEDVGETHAQMQQAGMWISLDFWESDLITYIKIKNMHLFNIVTSFLEFILQGSRKKPWQTPVYKVMDTKNSL